MDSAWFFSALMQSTAALVAIVGGFLVSRLISHGTELRRLDEAAREAQEKVDDSAVVAKQHRDAGGALIDDDGLGEGVAEWWRHAHSLDDIKLRALELLRTGDLASGFRALLWLVVLGVLLPGLILAVGPESVVWWVRGLVFVGFVLALARLLCFVRGLIRSTTIGPVASPRVVALLGRIVAPLGRIRRGGSGNGFSAHPPADRDTDTDRN